MTQTHPHPYWIMAYVCAGVFGGIGLGAQLRVASLYAVIAVALLILALTVRLVILAYRATNQSEVRK